MTKTKKAADHQPTKAKLEEEVKIDASPDELAAAFLRGGAARREPKDATTEVVQ